MMCGTPGDGPENPAAPDTAEPRNLTSYLGWRINRKHKQTFPLYNRGEEQQDACWEHKECKQSREWMYVCGLSVPSLTGWTKSQVGATVSPSH